MLAMIGVGTVGNLLNIFVFISLKPLRQMTNSVFLIASFASSLILLWSYRFPTSLLTVTGNNLLIGSIVYCKIRYLFANWGANMVLTCVCLASIDRFLITSRNASFRRFFTLKRAYILVMIFTLAYLAICMPDGIYYSGYSCTASATARATYKEFITYFNLIVTNGLSMIVLGTFSILTWYNLRSRRGGGRNQLQTQVNRMMLVQFGMAIITTLPNFMYNIYSQATQSLAKSQLRAETETLWSNVSGVLSFTIHVGTFYLYVIVSPAYRRNVRTALCCKKRNRVSSEETQLQNGTTVHTLGNVATRP